MSAALSAALSMLSLGGYRVVVLDFSGAFGRALACVAHHVLGRAEQALWQGFALERKRLTWLAGRVAAKLALRLALAEDAPRREAGDLPHLRDLPVLPQTGRSGPPHSPIGGALSLSHSGTLAAAVHAPTPVGLDLEGLRPIGANARRWLLSSSEARLLGPDPDDAALTHLWAAKEAVLKARHAPNLAQMRGLRWHGWGQDGTARVTDTNGPLAWVHAGLWRGHAIALATYLPMKGERAHA
ncbi:4'-phosphopantetheinyl transferase family protein [Sagittula sp. S175]|uniref:4'-phosphopantetheinyl transferase family protein n=1 Tax=Sagittula sp. S175 TaxID=3415129 RepID=UPI003C7E7868